MFFSYASKETQEFTKNLMLVAEEQGADTLIWLATAGEPSRSTGGYWKERSAPQRPTAGGECFMDGETARLAPMTRDDVVAFVGRDWSAVAERKARYWAMRKAGLSLPDLLRLSADLREHARAVRPDWPTAEDRAADAAVHARVSSALCAVSRLRPR